MRTKVLFTLLLTVLLCRQSGVTTRPPRLELTWGSCSVWPIGVVGNSTRTDRDTQLPLGHGASSITLQAPRSNIAEASPESFGLTIVLGVAVEARRYLAARRDSWSFAEPGTSSITLQASGLHVAKIGPKLDVFAFVVRAVVTPCTPGGVLVPLMCSSIDHV